MAYDKHRKDEIDTMGVADLIHTMLIEFDPNASGNAPCFQSTAYFWVHERLNELLPADNTDEIITAASDAADAAQHGFSDAA